MRRLTSGSMTTVALKETMFAMSGYANSLSVRQRLRAGMHLPPSAGRDHFGEGVWAVSGLMQFIPG